METIVERPAALDVHKEQVTACVRVPGKRGRREQHVAQFQTTVRGLLGLRDWLAEHRVTHMCGAPIVMGLLVNAPENQRRDIPAGIKMMTAGAAPPAALV